MKIEELKQHIREYDSDTFSAIKSKITDDEIEKLIEKMLLYLYENEIDGVWLDQMLGEVRFKIKDVKEFIKEILESPLKEVWQMKALIKNRAGEGLI